MHPKNLNIYTVRQLRSISIWAILSILALGSSGYYADYNKHHSQKISGELKSLESKNEALKAKLNLATIALTTWHDTIQKQHLDRSGLKIKEAQTLLDQLKQTYRINNVSINLSTPEKRIDIDSKYVDIEYSTVNLGFDAYTDIDAFLFLNNLTMQMPGHIIIKSIVMSAKPSVDPAILQNVAGHQETALITTKVELLWQDLQDKVRLLDEKEKIKENTLIRKK